MNTADDRTMKGVVLPDGIDHLVYAVPDLEAGMDTIERRLGVRPAPGGRHPAFGTHNALVSLGPAVYLEIIAPDPGLPRPDRGRVFGLDSVPGGALRTWALRTERIDEDRARAAGAGLDLGDIEPGRRQGPDGSLLTWRLTDPYAMPLGGSVPFLISWGATPHPARAAPKGGDLIAFRLEHPEPGRVRAALAVLRVEVDVRPSDSVRFVASVRIAAKDVDLS